MKSIGASPRRTDDLTAKLEVALKERDEARAQLADLRPIRCSFCAKSQHEVIRLFAGPTVFICDECVAACNAIIADGKGAA